MNMKRRNPWLAVFVVLCSSVACGGSKSSPPSPTSPGPTVIPPPPSALSVSSLSWRERSVTLAWSASAGATAYIVEVGSAPGAADVQTTNASGPGATISGLRLGRTFARVKARNDAGTSAASNEVPLFVADFQDFVEALFLGSGAAVGVGAPNNHCPLPGGGRLSGFNRGSVRARIWTGLGARGYRTTIERTLNQATDASIGAVTFAIESTDDRSPAADTNQVSFGFIENDATCPLACTRGMWISPGIFRWAATWYTQAIIDRGDPAPFAHEVAHATLGMCHVDSDSIGGDTNSIMATRATGTIGLPSELTRFDIEATKAVYGAGLNAGAAKDDFRRAGLVK